MILTIPTLIMNELLDIMKALEQSALAQNVQLPTDLQRIAEMQVHGEEKVDERLWEVLRSLRATLDGSNTEDPAEAIQNTQVALRAILQQSQSIEMPPKKATVSRLPNPPHITQVIAQEFLRACDGKLTSFDNEKRLIMLKGKQWRDSPENAAKRIARMYFNGSVAQAIRYIFFIADGKTDHEAKQQVSNEAAAEGPSYPSLPNPPDFNTEMAAVFIEACGGKLVSTDETKRIMIIGQTKYEDSPSALTQRFGGIVFNNRGAIRLAINYVEFIRDGKTHEEAKNLAEEKLSSELPTLPDPSNLSGEIARKIIDTWQGKLGTNDDKKRRFTIDTKEHEDSPRNILRRYGIRLFNNKHAVQESIRYIALVAEGKTHEEAKLQAMQEASAKEPQYPSLPNPPELSIEMVRVFASECGGTLSYKDKKKRRITLGQEVLEDSAANLIQRIARTLEITVDPRTFSMLYLKLLIDGKTHEEAKSMMETAIASRILRLPNPPNLTPEIARLFIAGCGGQSDPYATSKIIFSLEGQKYAGTPCSFVQRIKRRVFANHQAGDALACRYIQRIAEGKAHDEAKILAEKDVATRERNLPNPPELTSEMAQRFIAACDGKLRSTDMESRTIIHNEQKYTDTPFALLERTSRNVFEKKGGVPVAKRHIELVAEGKTHHEAKREAQMEMNLPRSWRERVAKKNPQELKELFAKIGIPGDQWQYSSWLQNNGYPGLYVALRELFNDSWTTFLKYMGIEKEDPWTEKVKDKSPEELLILFKESGIPDDKWQNSEWLRSHGFQQLYRALREQCSNSWDVFLDYMGIEKKQPWTEKGKGRSLHEVKVPLEEKIPRGRTVTWTEIVKDKSADQLRMLFVEADIPGEEWSNTHWLCENGYNGLCKALHTRFDGSWMNFLDFMGISPRRAHPGRGWPSRVKDKSPDELRIMLREIGIPGEEWWSSEWLRENGFQQVYRALRDRFEGSWDTFLAFMSVEKNLVARVNGKSAAELLSLFAEMGIPGNEWQSSHWLQANGFPGLYAVLVRRFNNSWDEFLSFMGILKETPWTERVRDKSSDELLALFNEVGIPNQEWRNATWLQRNGFGGLYQALHIRFSPWEIFLTFMGVDPRSIFANEAEATAALYRFLEERSLAPSDLADPQKLPELRKDPAFRRLLRYFAELSDAEERT